MSAFESINFRGTSIALSRSESKNLCFIKIASFRAARIAVLWLEERAAPRTKGGSSDASGAPVGPWHSAPWGGEQDGGPTNR